MSAVSRKNQVTIPAEEMRASGIAPGDDVRIRSVGPGRLELVKSDELVAQYAGIFDDDVYPPGYLEEVRDGWA
jgi:bifunctional DNA-binding transcriptional regulator/antitoxin component of YhaV-PrlF toxin-antitoxin module